MCSSTLGAIQPIPIEASLPIVSKVYINNSGGFNRRHRHRARVVTCVNQENTQRLRGTTQWPG